MKERDENLLEETITQYRRLTGGRNLKDDLNQAVNWNSDPEHWAMVVCEYFNILRTKLFESRGPQDNNSKAWYYYLCWINGIKTAAFTKHVGRNPSTADTVLKKFAKNVSRDPILKDIKIKLLHYPLNNYRRNTHSLGKFLPIIEKAKKSVLSHFCITEKELYGDTSKPGEGSPRSWLYLICVNLGVPSKRLGMVMGKDHTTILRTTNTLRKKIKGNIDMQKTHMVLKALSE